MPLPVAAQSCLPGLPCVNAGADNSDKTESEACDADFMNQIYARAFLEASRETMMASVLIRKPDSVLEYTCFDQEAKKSADYAGAIFTETQRFVNVDVPNLGSSGGGLGGFLGNLISGLDIPINVPIIDVLEEGIDQLGGIANLELPEGLSLQNLANELEGLNGEELQNRFRELAPDAFEQFEGLANEAVDSAEGIATDVLETVSNGATQIANVSIENTRQDLIDFAESSAGEITDAAQRRLVDSVNRTLGDTQDAITGAINRAENFSAQAQSIVNDAQAVVVERGIAVQEAEEEFLYAQSLGINQAEIDAAAATLERAEAGLEGAQNAAEEIAAEANALQSQANDLIGQADSLLGDARAFSDQILSGSPEEIVDTLGSAVNLTDEVTEATEAFNVVAGDVTRLAEGATELVSGAARVAEILNDPAGAAIDFATSLLPTEVGQFLSLGGIEDSIEIPLNVAFEVVQLDLTLDSFLSDTVNNFIGTNFSHDFLGGAAFGFNNSIFDENGNPQPNAILNAGDSCAFMNSVYFEARCNANFGLDDQFVKLNDLASLDLRSLPQTCANPIVENGIYDVAMNTGFQYASFDRVDSFVAFAESNNCQSPIPTGLKVRQDIFETDIAGNVNLVEQRIFDDMICVNPGCYFNNGSCVNG